MMERVPSILPFLAVLSSLVAVPFILWNHKRPNMREGISLLAGVVKFLIVLSMIPGVLEGKVYEITLVELFENVGLSLSADLLGCLFALVASFLWIVTSIYSIGYMRGLKEHSQTRYYAFFALALSSTMGVAFAKNLLTLYIFYELLSLSTYPLVTHHQDSEARSSGRKYLTYLLGASVGLALPAIIWLYSHSNTLDFQPQGLLKGIYPSETGIVFFMLIFGFAKAAIVPFHAWLPAAMVAPTPVSALLHAVAVVKAGAFSLVRVILEIFGQGFLAESWAGPGLYIATSLTILFGSLMAMYQKELKRILAFSTVSQLSYIVLGVSILSPLAVKGGILHLAMHAFGKITLFFAAGAIYVAVHKKFIQEMEGLGRYMPITFGAFFLASLSIIGLPPLGGFLSKWNLALGAYQGMGLSIMGVFLLSSLLNVAYFIPIAYKAFFPSEPVKWEFKEAPLFCLVPMVITAIISVLLFFYPNPFLRIAEYLTKSLGG
jgi:multicomponent Na+:H+ antiporter subunit D